MSSCPKCGHKLHLYNVSQFCPNCNVNLRFCNFEENFYREAKEAELNLARMHVKLRHMKVAFIGSKLSIVRLVTVIFPILALFLSAGSVCLTLPFYSETTDLTALGVYNAYNNGIINYILKSSSSVLISSHQFALARNIFVFYVVPAVFAAIVLLMTILCFISYKNMPKITAITAGVGALVSVIMGLLINSTAASLTEGVVTAKGGIALFVVAASFLIVAVANALLVKFKPKVEYEEGDWERYQILLQVKRGEVDFDSLPQPIVETAETREIEEEIQKGLKHFEDEEGRKEIESGDDSSDNEIESESKTDEDDENSCDDVDDAQDDSEQ